MIFPLYVWENLVMTSAYEQTNAIRADSGGRGGAFRGKPHGGSKEMPFFLGGVCQKSTHLYSRCQQTIGDVNLTLKIEFI